MEDNECQKLLNGSNQAEKAAAVRKSTISNANSYATQKTIAGGIMNLALLTSNGNQLKIFISHKDKYNPLDRIIISLIAFSILLQIFMGFLAIAVGTSKVCVESGDEEYNEIEDTTKNVGKRKLYTRNRWITGLSLLSTVVNILISTLI